MCGSGAKCWSGDSVWRATWLWLAVAVAVAVAQEQESAGGVTAAEEGEAGPVVLLHWARWGPLAAEAPLLLVVCEGGPAGDQAAQLRQLLRSLGRVRGVHSALLVLAVAGRRAQAEAEALLAREARFCKAALVACPTGRHEAVALRWWAWRWAFERAPWAPAHRGPVVLLRPAQLVAEDALHVLRHARRTPALAAALGGVAPALAPERPGPHPPHDAALLALQRWRPAFAAGLALDARAWRRLASSGAPRLAALQVAACAAPRVVAAGAAGERALGGLRREGALFPPRVRSVHLWRRGGRLTAPAQGGPWHTD